MHLKQNSSSLCQRLYLSDDPKLVRIVTESASGFYSVALTNYFEFNSTSHSKLLETEMTVSAFDFKITANPIQAAVILLRGFDCGLSLAGICIVREDEVSELVIAWRGVSAISKWLQEVGPMDPELARRTDPQSLRALYGGDRLSKSMISCPRNRQASMWSLAFYFGDRAGVKSVAAPERRPGKRSLSFPRILSKVEDQAGRVLLPSVVTRLSSQVLLLVSHSVATRQMGTVVLECANRGFAVESIKRLRINRCRDWVC
eukprot:m.297784 g.297784  ORF g.297784 m.297784 type:complete len:259 (+) comp40776_c0_seq3:1599-2375(+)